MAVSPLCWTVHDLAAFPDDGGQKRYEIIGGDLFVTRAPHFRHQKLAANLQFALAQWSRESGQGITVQTPGLIFTDTDSVIPDLIWISQERLTKGLDEAGHLTLAPELVVEIVSPGKNSGQRDRQVKLKLYSRHGVLEYWVVDGQLKTLELFRREEGQLRLLATLYEEDVLTSPLLPRFALPVGQIFDVLSP